MITLNSETPIGLIATSPGAIGMISSTGSFGANSRVKISYSFSGSLSNIYAGFIVTLLPTLRQMQQWGQMPPHQTSLIILTALILPMRGKFCWRR
jgi:hypothetical protein